MNVALEAHELRVCYGRRTIFDRVGLRASAASFVALVGPNGAGKSSLLRVLAGVQRPASGEVTRPKRTSLIVSSVSPPADVSPRELASYGPAIARAWWRIFDDENERAVVDAALGRVGLRERADDPARTLSDGEIQRAWLAAALATSPQAVLIDEPTTHLDLRYQIEVMTMLRALARSGVAVVAAIHDLTLAARFADVIALLAGGSLRAGPPDEVLEDNALSAAFGVGISTHRDPLGGHIVCIAR